MLDHRPVFAGFQRKPLPHISPVQFGSDDDREYGVEEQIFQCCGTGGRDPAEFEESRVDKSNEGIAA